MLTDDERSRQGRRSIAALAVRSVAVATFITVAALVSSAGANRSAAKPFKPVAEPHNTRRALSPSYTDFSGTWKLTSTEGDMDAMLQFLNVGGGGWPGWSLRQALAAVNYGVGLERRIINMTRDHVDTEVIVGGILHEAVSNDIDGKLHTISAAGMTVTAWAEWINGTLVSHQVAPVQFLARQFLLPDGRMRTESTSSSFAVAVVYTRDE